MRRIILASILLLAACARTPAPRQPAEQAPSPVEAPAHAGALLGLTANELVGHFGRPALQVREGTSLKLQFRGRQCMLDAYLYPARDGQLRTTHVDSRSPSGVDIDQAACIFALENPS